MPHRIISAWDVHLDGFIAAELRTELVKRGFIEMDYISTNGEPITTLTMHFLRPQECRAEYVETQKIIERMGGFIGHIYVEDPLGFVVYGETDPRPIVMPSSIV